MRLRLPSTRALLWCAGVGMAVFLATCSIAAIRLVSIASDLRHARSDIDQASADIREGRLSDARAKLTNAEQLLVVANDRMYGRIEFDLIDWAPVIRQNLDALQSSVALALQLVHGGNQLLEITRPLENAQGRLEVSLRHGAVPLAEMQKARQQIQELTATLPSGRPSSSLLVGPVADAQRRLYDEALTRRAQLDNVGRGLKLLASLAGADAPRRYLIAVANPAEMRGAGGMILSYGILESRAGTFSLGDFGGIDDLLLNAPVDAAALRLPADYLNRWSGREPTLLWRNTTLAPDFRFDAPVMEAMFTAKTGLPVDGVIQIDPAGLAALLRGTGPINVPGVGQVTADNVLDLTINRAYIDFPRRDQRQEVLGDVARAAFDALVNGEFDSLRPFGEALFNAAAARHLILYANDPATSAQASFFHADGALPDPQTQDYALMTVQNFSRNKLDYYVDTSIDLSGSRPTSENGELSAIITVANTAPSDVPSTYIMGPNFPGESSGLYRGTVSLYLPSGTRLIDASGSASPPTLSSEAGRTVTTYDVQLRPGQTSTVSLQLELVPRPSAPYAIQLVPVPRVRPTVFSVDIDDGSERLALRPAAPLVVPETVRAGAAG
ncbi:MAG: hypothetical protein QOI95_3484 [Acidimicrobiaceae bacterium]|jgi:hypothetical protein